MGDDGAVSIQRADSPVSSETIIPSKSYFCTTGNLQCGEGQRDTVLKEKHFQKKS